MKYLIILLGMVVLWWVITYFLSGFMGFGFGSMLISGVIVVCAVRLFNGQPTDER